MTALTTHRNKSSRGVEGLDENDPNTISDNPESS